MILENKIEIEVVVRWRNSIDIQFHDWAYDEFGKIIYIHSSVFMKMKLYADSKKNVK